MKTSCFADTERELVLIKVRVPPGPARAEVMQLVDVFRARVVDVSEKTLTLAVTGDAGKVSVASRQTDCAELSMIASALCKACQHVLLSRLSTGVFWCMSCYAISSCWQVCRQALGLVCQLAVCLQVDIKSLVLVVVVSLTCRQVTSALWNSAPAPDVVDLSVVLGRDFQSLAVRFLCLPCSIEATCPAAESLFLHADDSTAKGSGKVQHRRGCKNRQDLPEAGGGPAGHGGVG